MLERLQQLRPVGLFQDRILELNWAFDIGDQCVFPRRPFEIQVIQLIRSGLGSFEGIGRSVVCKLAAWSGSYRHLLQGQVSYQFQQCLLSESMPVLLHGVIALEEYMMDLETLGKDFPVLKPWTAIGMDWGTKYYTWMDDTKAYVVAMCKSSNWLFHIYCWPPPSSVSSQSFHTIHPDQRTVGTLIYLGFEGGHFGACKCNLLFWLYLNDILCRYTSTITWGQWALPPLQLQHYVPLANLLQPLEGCHTQHGSELENPCCPAPGPRRRIPVSKLSSGNMPLVRSLLKGLISCSFGRWDLFRWMSLWLSYCIGQ